MSNAPNTIDNSRVQLGDQYQLTSSLASGGAARIFLAKQMSLDREVVVKVLRRQLSIRPEFRDRFVHEAKLLAHLAHPNIVQIIDFGEQEGFCYFVMEYVRGGSLRELMERGVQLPVDVVLAIGYFTARGLHYVHEHNILHLDIKPANILLTRQGMIKVADFGLARLIDKSEGDASRKHPAGTPLYMSPEQVQGAKLDFRTDIFSFGVVLYQLLTQRNPFVADTTDLVYRNILACCVEPPSVLRPETPPLVDALVMSCLQRDRELRPAETETLIAELHNVMEKLAIHRPEERLRSFLWDPLNYKPMLRRGETSPWIPSRRRGAHFWLKLGIAALIGVTLLLLEYVLAGTLPLPD
jgi:serine/threonine-protein kinase